MCVREREEKMTQLSGCSRQMENKRRGTSWSAKSRAVREGDGS